MTRHLLRLIWHRKRQNLLVMTEILLSFVVLFGVTTLALFYADNYRRPLGFRYDDVYSLKMSRPGEWSKAAEETTSLLVREVAALPEVAQAAAAFEGPFESGAWTSSYVVEGKALDYAVNVVGDGFGEAMGLEVTRGRFFGREDDGSAFQPVVINERMAAAVFPGLDPLGRAVPQERERNGEAPPEMRVVGVVRDFRQHGEFTAPEQYLFHRQVGKVVEIGPPRFVVVKVRPGTNAAFEAALVARARAIAPDWSFTVSPLSERRTANHRDHLAALVVVTLVAGFLLLMVALGLTGVLWQNVTERTREIGLRRAKGAAISAVHAQILGEILVMTTLSVAVGALVAVQIPLFDQVTGIGAAVYASSLMISVLAIFGLTVACGYYPSRLATRMTPAEALRYE